MRVLLDECLPARLREHLPGHEIQTVPRAGWAGIKNGRLLRRRIRRDETIISWAGIKNGRLLRLIADSGKFDVFLTVDKNLPREQIIAGLSFAVVVLRARSNRIASVCLFAPEILRCLSEFQPGHVYFLSE